jgi:hypothetical protein
VRLQHQPETQMMHALACRTHPLKPLERESRCMQRHRGVAPGRPLPVVRLGMAVSSWQYRQASRAPTLVCTACSSISSAGGRQQVQGLAGQTHAGRQPGSSEQPAKERP